MARYVRMQESRSVSTNTTQEIRDAIDLGDDREAAVQVTVETANTQGTLSFQHAAVLAETQFEPIGNTVDLAVVGPKTILITGHTRYLRWKTANMNGPATFRIDSISRK